MNDKKLRLIHTAFGCVISAALIVAAVCLIVSAYTIYNLGDSPYTPESIGAEYAKIAVPLWVAIFAVIAGILLNILLPMPKIKSKSDKDPFIKLRILQKKLGEGNETVKIKREREFRKLMRFICAILCLASFIPAVILLTWFDHFTVDNLTPSLLETVQLLLVGVIISGVLLFVLSIIESKSAEREIEWTKVALTQGEKSDKKPTEDKKNTVKIVRLVLLAVACALVVIGLTQDGFYDVLQKAIRICTECIGLG
jgi:hypothetical protein